MVCTTEFSTVHMRLVCLKQARQECKQCCSRHALGMSEAVQAEMQAMLQQREPNQPVT